ncbi:MAG: hypothetical protein IPJ41_03110 [Phycisphaerales bacterium]|nr:hypothetical protein [Phycisphaerales bacterium]
MLLGRPVILQDDTGVRRELISLGALRRDERRAAPAFEAAVDRAARARLLGGTGAASLAVLIPVWIVIGVVRAALPQVPAVLVYLVGYSAGGALAYLIWLGGLSVYAQAMAAALLADGICPACAYNLGAQPVVDGVAVCPECGATWRADRIRSRHQFASSVRAGAPGGVSGLARFLGLGSGGPTSITDDRAERRPIVSPWLASAIRAAGGPKRERLIAARREIRRHGRVRRIIPAAFFAFACGFLAFNAFKARRFPSTPTSMWMFVAPSAAIGAVYLPLSSLCGCSGITADHVRAAMLRRRLCPSCAADLDGVPTGGRLCHCQHCGAVWQFGPATSPSQ